MIAMLATAIASAAGLKKARASQRATSLGTNSAGISASEMPRRSPSWLAAITMAMPMVKPLITASGTKRMSEATRVTAAMTRITPAISVAVSKPSTPC